MLRILFDEEGNGHGDILLKIDGMISKAFLVDTKKSITI